MQALVVGCGLSGAVAARHLAESGRNVVIWERRNHIGGNMYDYVDDYGILVHKYGPHTFHTVKKELLDYMSRFCEWEEYHLACGTVINGICTPTPFNFQTIDDFYSYQKAEDIKYRIHKVFGDRKTATVFEVLQCDDSVVRQYAEFLFRNDYSLYTAKQWGLKPDEINPEVLNRVPIRFNYESGYFDDEYQVMPKISFTEFFQNLLNHPRIVIKLGVEALYHLHIDQKRKILLLQERPVDIPVIYTGALDELFAYRYGALPYRSLHFEWHHEEKESKQNMPVVAYPQADGFTRIVEFKKLPMQNVSGTTYEVEYPLAYQVGQGNEPYYPVLTAASQQLHAQYKAIAAEVKNLYYCGRLADFQYYNMDQALRRSICYINTIVDTIL